MPTIVTGPDVPVVPATAKHLNQKTLATVVTGIGAVMTTLQEASPTLTAMFPHQTWIGHAITAGGFIWLAYQRAADAKSVQVTNYSVPAPDPAVVNMVPGPTSIPGAPQTPGANNGASPNMNRPI